MANLFSTLRGAADALSVFERQLSVAQNNVANVSTPGFARQRMSAQAKAFDPKAGVQGGVTAGPVESARDIFSEAAVQREVTSSGRWSQQVDTLSALQNGFDLTGEAGIPGALNRLFESFSTWSVTPNDSTARLGVMTAAGSVADAFNETYGLLARASTEADTQIVGIVERVNTLAGTLRQLNLQRKAGNHDPAIEAGMYSALEELSELVPVTTLRQSDGALTVLLGGQTPLVVGEFQYSIGSTVAVPDTPPPVYPSGAPSAIVVDSAGRDIRAQITSGKLGGLLEVRNGLFASLRGDGSRQGDLNQLAQAVADRVNSLLTSGNLDQNTPPTTGVPLFYYDPANPASAALSLKVDDGATAANLAAIDPGPPYRANGIALKLAALASPTDPADKVGNLSYMQFYGGIAADVGNAVAAASSNLALHSDLVAQARELRQRTSGVSLDEEAINVLQFQRSYQAASKMITVLDDLTQTVVNLIR